jgi:oligoribonuclease NrnB/cAMP/cGMP phosphodiesterase (DHH superfamily)
MDLIITHQNCPDGWAAAYVAKLRYPEAKILTQDHGLEPPYNDVTGKNVLVVDFSWRTREQNDKLASLAKSFKIFDHHKSAKEVLDGASYAVFDMERSGAGLAWDYLYGKDAPIENNPRNRPRPWFIDYVEDRDLWRHALPESEAVNGFIMTFAYEIQAWDQMIKTDLRDAITNGKAVQLEINKYVREIIKQTQVGSLNVLDKKYSVGLVNAPYLHISDVGNALAHRYDIGMGWFERSDGIVQFSMRSHNPGDIDVSVIAKGFGGGGHKHAAGFQLSLTDGRKLVDQILGRS